MVWCVTDRRKTPKTMLGDTLLTPPPGDAHLCIPPLIWLTGPGARRPAPTHRRPSTLLCVF